MPTLDLTNEEHAGESSRRRRADRLNSQVSGLPVGSKIAVYPPCDRLAREGGVFAKLFVKIADVGFDDDFAWLSAKPSTSSAPIPDRPARPKISSQKRALVFARAGWMASWPHNVSLYTMVAELRNEKQPITYL